MTTVANNTAGNIASVPENLDSIFVMAGIIVVAGMIGGYAAYLTQDGSDNANGAAAAPAKRFFILGVVAAACVPLFLSLVRSEVVSVILTNRTGQRLESYLVFIGLCLIAAFSSRRFIESVSQRILQQVERANVKAEQAERTAEAAQETALEIADERSAEVQGSQETIDSDAQQQSLEIGGLSTNEARALRALTKMSYRTATGVAADVGMPRNQIGEVLDSLAGKGLAMVTQSPTTKGVRWKITAAGIEATNVAH